MPENVSEALVSRLVARTSLSLWSYANPLNSEGKELCDVLVVCDPHVILISVKEVLSRSSSEPELGWERWSRRAIEASAKQLYGAERELHRLYRVRLSNGGFGLPIPPANTRRVHRVAVAFGSDGRIPFTQGDLGKGFVHVFDETALDTILAELDTVTDLLSYLEAKEALTARDVMPIVVGEENLLAVYLSGNRSFPTNCSRLIVDDRLWDELTRRAEWKARKAADRESYTWDGTVEWVTRDIRHQSASDPDLLAQQERALRVLAKECRFARRGLGRALVEFLDGARHGRLRARTTTSPSGVAYVFLACEPGFPRAQRAAELAARCFVVRGITPGVSTVAGIATEIPGLSDRSSVDLALLQKDEWTQDDEARCQALRESGLFRAPRRTRVREDEYPGVSEPTRVAVATGDESEPEERP